MLKGQCINVRGASSTAMGAKRVEESSGHICGVLVATMPSAEEARKTARAMSRCPYVIATGTTGNKFCNVLVVPESKRWWLEYPQRRPDIIGAKRVSLTVIDELLVPDRLEERVSDKRLDTAPCGADCLECPLRQEFDCSGCPATTHHV